MKKKVDFEIEELQKKIDMLKENKRFDEISESFGEPLNSSESKNLVVQENKQSVFKIVIECYYAFIWTVLIIGLLIFFYWIIRLS